MKIFKLLTVFTLLLFQSTGAMAQAGFDVSGSVSNGKDEPLKGATVFIGGTERVTASDGSGHFVLHNVPAGTYQLSVQMIGYEPATKSIIVKNAAIKADLQLQEKTISLNQVTISNSGAWERNFKLFKEKFLGLSANAKQCIIINPKVINFSTKKGQLMADADDFLIIENKLLGYRLHYLLRGFVYTRGNGMIQYHGECSFEELSGTDAQKKDWAKNRLKTYQGSFTHFLRSVYSNNTVENGFITNPFFSYVTFKYDTTLVELPNYGVIQNRQIKFDSLITAIDTNFASFKFRQPLYVIYDPNGAKKYRNNQSDRKESVKIDRYGSVINMATNQAIIDTRGSYNDYKAFLIHGYWAKSRVGDQLPLEYKPPVADIPRNAIVSNQMLSSLQKWTDSIPQEKAYLHLDKPYYALGDTIWFKGYLTSGSRHLLSPLSGAAYIDLIDDQNKAIRTLKLPVDSGTLAGNLILYDDIKPGSYRIRAYTQWMRNAGEEYFFNHAFTIGNPEKQVNQSKPDLQKTDIQFFPESGNLVNGLNSRVGFKASGTDGLGESISGAITDNDNNQLAQITTLYAGMGSFLLKPASGKTYTADIKFRDGSTKKIALPTALNDGYILSIYQPNQDSLLVRVQASASLQHSTIHLIVHNSGEVIYSSPIDIEGLITSVWLDKKSFPSGIAQFTIFNDKNEPLNERIAFIKNSDRMQLAIKTDKAVYKTRDHVELELAAKDGDGFSSAANFSVSVINENRIPVDENAENTIFTNLLLTSDLKGYIEKPNYYFAADSDQVNKALDNLMLTQGYHRFEWKSLPDIIHQKPPFPKEDLKYTISGTVTNLQHRVLPNASVMLFSMKAGMRKVTTTDDNGRFKFDSLLFADSAKFAIQARTKENSTHNILTLDSIPAVTINKQQNLAEATIIKGNLQRAVDSGLPLNLNGPHVLRQVNIKDKRIAPPKDVNPQGNMGLLDEQSADHIYTIPDPENYVDLWMFLQQRVAGIIVKTDEAGNKIIQDVRPPNKKIDLIIDGGVGNASGIEYDLDQIAKIEIVRTNFAAFNAIRKGNDENIGGYLLILTKPTNLRKQHYDPNVANITPKGYSWVKQFYSPRYEHSVNNSKPDDRTTIYWNPYINTNSEGKARLDFYNADGHGIYRVVVEGINAIGELGRQVYHYTVN